MKEAISVPKRPVLAKHHAVASDSHPLTKRMSPRLESTNTRDGLWNGVYYGSVYGRKLLVTLRPTERRVQVWHCTRTMFREYLRGERLMPQGESSVKVGDGVDIGDAILCELANYRK